MYYTFSIIYIYLLKVRKLIQKSHFLRRKQCEVKAKSVNCLSYKGNGSFSQREREKKKFLATSLQHICIQYIQKIHILVAQEVCNANPFVDTPAFIVVLTYSISILCKIEITFRSSTTLETKPFFKILQLILCLPIYQLKIVRTEISYGPKNI